MDLAMQAAAVHSHSRRRSNIARAVVNYIHAKTQRAQRRDAFHPDAPFDPRTNCSRKTGKEIAFLEETGLITADLVASLRASRRCVW
jgi:hypothetical protein